MKDILLNEVRFFINSILWGVILLILYDVLRIFRRVVKHNQFTTIIEDVIYWIINGILIFRMMYEYNDGIIRAFTIIGLLLGMILYHNSLSDMVVEYISNGINRTIAFINKVIGTIINTILWPFRWIYKQLKKIFGFLYKKLASFVKKRIKKLVLPLIIGLKNSKKRFNIKLSKVIGNEGSNKEGIENEKKEN